MPKYFLSEEFLLASLYGEQSRFDANLIKTYKVLSSKEVQLHSHSTSYLEVMPESFYKVTFLLLHIVSASPAWVTDYSAMTPQK